jgi:hypothetical protein
VSDDDLLEQQQRLQREADAVHADLRLDELLGGLGDPIRVGSSALGLMVWPDLDVTVACPTLDLAAVASVGAELVTHPRVRQLTTLNDTGKWNADPTYPDGLYLGLKYRSEAGVEWKVDIWLVDEPERQPDLEHLRTLPPKLTDEARLRILEIKDAWADRPEYGRTVRSVDIYTAVLEDDVMTLEQFEAWLAGRDA